MTLASLDSISPIAVLIGWSLFSSSIRLFILILSILSLCSSRFFNKGRTLALKPGLGPLGSELPGPPLGPVPLLGGPWDPGLLGSSDLPEKTFNIALNIQDKSSPL